VIWWIPRIGVMLVFSIFLYLFYYFG